MKRIVVFLSIIFWTLLVSPQNTKTPKSSESTPGNVIQHPTDPTGARLSALEKRVNELEKAGKVSEKPANATSDRLAALEKKVSALEGSVSFSKYLINQKQNKYETIQLDPSSRTFQRIDGDVSTFLVLVDDVSPYLNGYRIKLKIGNPSDAQFSNAKLKVRWARSYDFSNYSAESYKQWESSIQEKEVPLNDNLVAGSWNSVTVDLVPCAANEMGFLELSITTPSVILHSMN